MYTVDNEVESIWDGERLEVTRFDGVAVEHLHRYAIAIELIRGKNVLDIASGEGYGSHLMAMVAANVVGVDISKEAITHAQNKYDKDNLKFLHGSADEVPVESNSIDVVVSFETIEHHDKHEEMMLEIKRVLKTDGLLIMSSPDKLNYSDIPKQQNPYHVKELYLEEFKDLIGKHFENTSFFLQKMVFASLIAPEEKVSGFKEYEGGYDYTNSSEGMKNPLYVICIASDGHLDDFDVSIFNGKDALDKMLRISKSEAEIQINRQFAGSRSYKLGQLITLPLRVLKRIVTSLK
jgi:ubiquinone/menaquinone biosynthesis C-methylase UbiE